MNSELRHQGLVHLAAVELQEPISHRDPLKRLDDFIGLLARSRRAEKDVEDIAVIVMWRRA